MYFAFRWLDGKYCIICCRCKDIKTEAATKHSGHAKHKGEWVAQTAEIPVTSMRAFDSTKDS